MHAREGAGRSPSATRGQRTLPGEPSRGRRVGALRLPTRHAPPRSGRRSSVCGAPGAPADAPGRMRRDDAGRSGDQRVRPNARRRAARRRRYPRCQRRRSMHRRHGPRARGLRVGRSRPSSAPCRLRWDRARRARNRLTLPLVARMPRRPAMPRRGTHERGTVRSAARRRRRMRRHRRLARSVRAPEPLRRAAPRVPGSVRRTQVRAEDCLTVVRGEGTRGYVVDNRATNNTAPVATIAALSARTPTLAKAFDRRDQASSGRSAASTVS